MARRNNIKRAKPMMHTLISRQDSIDILIEKLRSKEVFTFVRYGDGDYKMMYAESIGRIVGGNNRFLVTKEFRKELIDSYNIEDKNWLIGTSIGDVSKRSTARNIKEDKLPILHQRDKLLAVGCLMDSFIEDIERFKLFADEMRKTSTMFVCNYNHKNLEKAYGEIKVFVKVPKQNSYSEIDTFYKEILKGLDKVDKIVLSAGQSSRIIAKRLYDTSKEITVVDVGSVSDMLILNTSIINKIPQRSHLNIYRGQIIKSLMSLLGEKTHSKLIYKGKNKSARNKSIIRDRRRR
jgi:hypothetical protein